MAPISFLNSRIHGGWKPPIHCPHRTPDDGHGRHNGAAGRCNAEREMAMVQFIVRADNPEVPPPYEFPGITIMSFRLPATLANLQSLCDQLLNIGSVDQRHFVYRAVASFVDMEIVTYPKMVFAQAPYKDWGFATQQEI